MGGTATRCQVQLAEVRTPKTRDNLLTLVSDNTGAATHLLNIAVRY